MATARSGYNCKFVNNALQHLAIDGVEITESKCSVGALGTVVEGKWVGAPCAIKQLRTEDATEYLSDRFLYECTLWSELKHPNVLQFYGLHFPLKDGYPVIVTELLQHNLDQYLTARPRAAVSLTTKAGILRDVSLAVRYLHSLKPPIIIRDLSASFVYLTPGLTAKLGEFGTATKFCNEDKEGLEDCHSESEASIPVSSSCSWPEQYSSFASDAYIFGDLILHVLLHSFPVPDDKIRMASTGSERCNVLTELARREKYLEQLTTEEKTFLPTLAHCYEEMPKARPSFTHLCTSLELIVAHLNSTTIRSSGNATGTTRCNRLQRQHECAELGSHVVYQADMPTSPVSEQVSNQAHPLSIPTRARGQSTNTGIPHHQMVIDSLHMHSQGEMSIGSCLQQFTSKTRHTSPRTSKPVDSTPQNETKAAQVHSCNDVMPAVPPRPETAIMPPVYMNTGRTSQCGISKKPSCTRTRSQSTFDSTPSLPFSASSTFSDSSAEMVSLSARRQSRTEVFTYALMRKDYKRLKRGETVMISPGGWDTSANSCTVQSEYTGVCENVHPASKFLEVLRPITDEPWFTHMSREDVEDRMQKEYNINGSFLVLRGASRGFILAVKFSGKTHFFQIFYNADQTFSLNKLGMPNFVTISELVREHTQQKMELATPLTVPYISKRMELQRESFTMDEQIHQGKHFVVWSGKFSASQDTSSTQIAVKTISMDKDRRKSSTAALYNEAGILNFIHRSGGHPNILKILGIYMQKKHPHLVVQLCYKFNLKQILNQHADLYTSEHLTHFASQIASAMAFLEEKDIVHRELKTANVLVTDNAECKLSGFHCALTTAKAQESLVAKEYAVTANPRWTAPEVYTSEDNYTSKSDVWSFGALLIELFTHGSEPYQGVGNHDIRDTVTKGPPPRIPHTCPSNIQSVIRQCLRKTASQRPAFVTVCKMLTY